MTNEIAPRHLNHHQQETVDRIFQHPITHNLTWLEVESLLEAVSDVEARHEDRIHVNLGDVSHVFVRPNTKDVDEKMVMDLRHMLRAAGYGPQDAKSS